MESLDGGSSQVNVAGLGLGSSRPIPVKQNDIPQGGENLSLAPLAGLPLGSYHLSP